MGNFVNITDFESGELKISITNFQEADLQYFIDKVEPDILTCLLGSTLYDLFITDWNGIAFSEQRFTDIYNAFSIDYEDCYIVKSKGIKKMLMYFIYYEYVTFQQNQNRVSGTKKTTSENSERVSMVDLGIYNIYNEGIETYNAIQWYICDKESDYPEYNGQVKNSLGWL